MATVTNDTPRRIHVELMTPAETAIMSAALAVEALGADERLTDAVVWLKRAQNKVGAYVDDYRAAELTEAQLPK